MLPSYIVQSTVYRKEARQPAGKLKPGQVTLLNLHLEPAPALAEFDCVIIVGSIHMGAIRKEVQRFCKVQEAELLQKKLGPYICCMLKEKQQEEFDNVYPKEYREHSVANGCFGREFLPEKMHLVHKLMVRVVAKTTESTSALDYEAVDRFTGQLRQHQGQAHQAGRH